MNPVVLMSALTFSKVLRTISNATRKIDSTLISLEAAPQHVNNLIHRPLKLPIKLGQILTQYNQSIQSPNLP